MTRNTLILNSYMIDHSGDPSIERGILKLGKQDCMLTIREHVPIGEWVIGTLGRGYKRKEFPNLSKNKNYLVYAMRVTSKQNNKVKRKARSKILSCSDEYFCFLDIPIELPRKFNKLVHSNRGYKKFPGKGVNPELVNSFLKWLKKHKTQRTSQNNLCKYSSPCVSKS